MGFYRTVLLIVALAFLGGGMAAVGGESAPGGYNLEASRRLRQVGEALLRAGTRSEQVDAAISALPPEGSAHFTQLRSALVEEKRQIVMVQRAWQYLAEGQLNELMLFIERAEGSDMATPELLELRGIPQALMALQLYCSRRPFQSARDLEQSLNFLRPYVGMLEHSSASFREFHRQQQLLLAQLRQQEEAGALAQLLSQLDFALATAGQQLQVRMLLSKIDAELPTTSFRGYIIRPGATGGAALKRWLEGGSALDGGEAPQGWLEIAIALSWNELNSTQRQQAMAAIKKVPRAVTLTGTAMKAGALNSPSLFNAALEEWRRRATRQEKRVEKPAFLADYFRSILAEEAFSGGEESVGRGSAAPWAGEVMERFQLILRQ